MSQLCNSSNKTATCAVLQQKCSGHLFSEAAGRSRAVSSLLSRLGFLSTLHFHLRVHGLNVKLKASSQLA